MTLLAYGVSFLVDLYLITLMGRVVFDWIRMFSRNWRPSGALLVLANLVYSLTDPPLRTLRRLIPPLRLGTVALDVAFLVLFFGLTLLRSLVVQLLLSL